MSFTETIAAGRAFARPGDPPIDANRELIASGAANLGGALFGAMPAGGGTSQTAVVRATGGRSQKASLVTAGVAAATMLLLAPLLGLLPHATLAATVIVYSVGLIQPTEFLAIRRIRLMELQWAIAAALGVLIFGTLKGIVVAIIISLIGLASQTAHPRVSVIGRKRDADVLRPLSAEPPDDETFPGLLILRPEGRLFFVNAQNVAEQIDAFVSQNLKREFPRIPLYGDSEATFWQWAAWGEAPMALHIGYEQVAPFALVRSDVADEKVRPAGQSPKCLLKSDKESGPILLDSETTLAGVPPEAWSYMLGNRCAIDWVLDQYKERKPKDPTIREKFDTYRFADHKKKVIDLLMRVTTVSVETARIVTAMAASPR